MVNILASLCFPDIHYGSLHDVSRFEFGPSHQLRSLTSTISSRNLPPGQALSPISKTVISNVSLGWTTWNDRNIRCERLYAGDKAELQRAMVWQARNRKGLRSHDIRLWGLRKETSVHTQRKRGGTKISPCVWYCHAQGRGAGRTAVTCYISAAEFLQLPR